MKITLELFEPNKDLLDQLVKSTTDYYLVVEKMQLAEYDLTQPNLARLTFVDQALYDQMQSRLHESCANSLGKTIILNLKDLLPTPDQLVVLKMVDHLREAVGLFTVSPRCEPGNSPSMHHLLWMLDQIQWDATQSLTKKHRWLGYIQGVLIERGILNLETERTQTRDILRGH